jgi:hypothetical protein
MDGLMDNVQEYILCAANFYDDGKEHVHKPVNITTGFVVCGRRHHNCINTFTMIVGFPYTEEGHILHRTEEQGFMTSKNRFVDREEGAKIAFNAGQIKQEKQTLYSEDLY